MSDLYTMSELVAEAYGRWEAGENKAAFALFARAAQKKQKLAYNSLGYFYDHGIGVRKDKERALYWYRRAARIGDSCAFYNLGLSYLGMQNVRRARYWLEKAAADGDEDASKALGNLKGKLNSSPPVDG
ncbi:tetratricopeptide repeat protein [Ramlibacter humi]|uniref:Sel1 repeat family protein n=1 Tax=Ramlibacter humi TaxID=2530451 RepID=A0A4Z0BCV7_9BURK|nr:tetratricopeptide repeat protein [Ramlibacter humi]TFY97106.1 sel1 repeat family protein [Ramlibacter humi]